LNVFHGQQEYAFTFGSDHTTWPNISLARRYVIFAGNYEEAREKMVALRDDQWAFQYPVDDAFWEMAAKWNWTRVKAESLEMGAGI